MQPNSPLALALLTAARRAGDSAEPRCRLLFERETAAQAWRQALQQALARGGLTEAGFAVLAVLFAARPAAMTCGTIAAAADLSRTRTAAALMRLELSGLIASDRDDVTHRRIALRLTAAGTKQVVAALQRYVQAAQTVTRQLTPAEIEAALAVAGKIREGAAQLEPNAVSAA